MGCRRGCSSMAERELPKLEAGVRLPSPARMRTITVDCDLCGQRVALERAKEALFQVGKNTYHLMDVCPGCLDQHLQAAESVNDTSGYRKKAAVLIRLPDGDVPTS